MENAEDDFLLNSLTQLFMTLSRQFSLAVNLLTYRLHVSLACWILLRYKIHSSRREGESSITATIFSY
jgi:hypothetical protein